MPLFSEARWKLRPWCVDVTLICRQSRWNGLSDLIGILLQATPKGVPAAASRAILQTATWLAWMSALT